MKISLFFLGLFLTVSATSHAGPERGGSGGRSFHPGFVARGLNRAVVQSGRFNGGGFRGRFFARRNRPVVFQQFGWPVYWYPWYPYGDSLDYSYLEPDSPDYQYWDSSSTQVRPEPTNRAVPQNPVIVVINAGNSRSTDSNSPMNPRGLMDRVYVDNGYISTNAGGQQRMFVQDPNEHIATGSVTPGDPVVPQATAVPQQNSKTPVQTGTGVFAKFVIVGWLKDGEKDVISVKNIETNQVQRITYQPNIDHFRIVEIHPNPDLRQFEAIISNGTDQGAVRFQF
ncbi:MAG: hypothetical protein JO170_20175 [Verrucomicrobia bacterium]|nr:hypothetical protein [Verrucomicrobiota bacterium]